jgi:putative nucleotidyltransferase with HDIG domain
MNQRVPILLISDRPDRNIELPRRLADSFSCRVVNFHEHDDIAGDVAAVLTDVSFRNPSDVQRLRHLLTKPKKLKVPILAILRGDDYLERVQASAIGADVVFPPDVPLVEVIVTLGMNVRRTSTPSKPTQKQTTGIGDAQAHFQFIFDAAARAEYINQSAVDDATLAVVAAISEKGIREWLEVVWAYDDTTYQHCLLVTGLAAEFCINLRFAPIDQKRLTRGALLHDIGKAKVPLAILNKCDALTNEEATIMRTHPSIGYEILRAQGGYEQEMLEIVLHHHELLDGSGYPDGLSGRQIGDLVRLVTICDIYAALIERRPYKSPTSPARAFKMLEEMDGKLERALVKAFAPVAEKSAAPRLAKSLIHT